MSLRVLITLVTLILAGTALSVRSFLEASEVYGAPPATEAAPPLDDCGACPDRGGRAEPAPEDLDQDALNAPDVSDVDRRAGDELQSDATSGAAPGSGRVFCPEHRAS